MAGRGFSLTNCKSRRMQQAGASDNNNMWGSCTEESQLWRHRKHQGTMLVPSAGGGRLWCSGRMANRLNIYIYRKKKHFLLYRLMWEVNFLGIIKRNKPMTSRHLRGCISPSVHNNWVSGRIQVHLLYKFSHVAKISVGIIISWLQTERSVRDNICGIAGKKKSHIKAGECDQPNMSLSNPHFQFKKVYR